MPRPKKPPLPPDLQVIVPRRGESFVPFSNVSDETIPHKDIVRMLLRCNRQWGPDTLIAGRSVEDQLAALLTPTRKRPGSKPASRNSVIGRRQRHAAFEVVRLTDALISRGMDSDTVAGLVVSEVAIAFDYGPETVRAALASHGDEARSEPSQRAYLANLRAAGKL